MDSRIWWTISAWAQKSWTVLKKKDIWCKCTDHERWPCCAKASGSDGLVLQHRCDGPTMREMPRQSISMPTWSWPGETFSTTHLSAVHSRDPLTIPKCQHIKFNPTFGTTVGFWAVDLKKKNILLTPIPTFQVSPAEKNAWWVTLKAKNRLTVEAVNLHFLDHIFPSRFTSRWILKAVQRQRGTNRYLYSIQ